jgi:hypothetical protein
MQVIYNMCLMQLRHRPLRYRRVLTFLSFCESHRLQWSITLWA